MAMKMNMKHAFTVCPTVINSLHRFSDCFAPDTCADEAVIQIFSIGDRIVTCKKNESASVGGGAYAARDKTHSLCSERVFLGEVIEYLGVKSACKFDGDLHFSFANPLR